MVDDQTQSDLDFRCSYMQQCLFCLLTPLRGSPARALGLFESDISGPSSSKHR